MGEFRQYKGHPHHQHSNVSSTSMQSSSYCCSNEDGDTLCCYNSKCGHFFNQYRGPLIVIAIGIGFMAVGAIPVSIAMATNTKNSALIIGAGFIGFGLIIFLPGLVWCVVQRLLHCSCCAQHCQCCISQQQFPLHDNEDDDDDDELSHTNVEHHVSDVPQHTLLSLPSNHHSVFKYHADADV